MNNDPDDFEKSVVSSIRWNLVLSFAGQLANIGITLVLSRLLSPNDFGMLAAALALVVLIETFGSLGSASALTQQQQPSDRFYSAVLIVSGTASVIIMLSIWVLSPFLASFYDKPDLETIFLLLSFSVPFQFLETFPLSRLQKNLAFDKIAIVSFFSIIVAGGIALFMADSGYGWLALVVRLFLLQAVRTIWFCMAAWPKFKFDFGPAEIKDLLRFGLPQSLSQFIMLFGRRIDDILIGKWMGTGVLGIYSLAYSLYMWPVANIKGRISQVVFAALSKVQGDPAAMGRYYLKTVSMATAIGFPAILGFASVCDLAVPIIMGEKWVAAIPLLRILGIASLFEVCIFPGAIYQALARTNTYLKTTMITRAITVAGILVGIGFGLQGIAYSIVMTSFLSYLVYNYFVGKLIPITQRTISSLIVRTGVYSFVMFGLILAFRFTFGGKLSPIMELSVSLLIGIFSYLLLIRKFRPELLSGQTI